MAKTKAKNKNKNGSPAFKFTLIILVLLIAIPIVALIFSSVLTDKANEKFNESMYPLEYNELVTQAANEYNVPESLIYGVMKTESNFDPNAVSAVGAIGLMQLMPDTYTWLQYYRTDFMIEEVRGSDDLYDPAINIDYGVFLLSFLIEKYDGDLSLVICSYNAGYGNVDEWIDNGTIPKNNVSCEDVPFPETANYLTKVTTTMEIYQALYYGEVLPTEE